MEQNKYWELNTIGYKRFADKFLKYAMEYGIEFFEDVGEFKVSVSDDGSIDIKFSDISVLANKYSISMDRRFNSFYENIKTIITILGPGYFKWNVCGYTLSIEDDGATELMEERNDNEDTMTICADDGVVHISKWRPQSIGLGLVCSTCISVPKYILDNDLMIIQENIRNEYAKVYEERLKAKADIEVSSDSNNSILEDNKGKDIGSLANKFFRLFGPRLFSGNIFYSIEVGNPISEYEFYVIVWLYKDSECVTIKLKKHEWPKTDHSIRLHYAAKKNENEWNHGEDFVLETNLLTDNSYIEARQKVFAEFDKILTNHNHRW